MSVPSVVVFDLGKVLVDFDYGIAAAKIVPRSKITLDQMRVAMEHSPLLYRFETGLMTNEEFAAEVCGLCGYTGTREEFYESFADIFSEIKPMTELNATLRAKGIPTSILSNTNGIAITHIRRRFPFFANFDHFILSYELGVMKPDRKIYEAVEKATGHRGDAIVYVDDRPENVEGGSALGWRGIIHETPEKTIPLLRKLGLPV